MFCSRYLQSCKTIIGMMDGRIYILWIKAKPNFDNNLLTLLSFSPIDFPKFYVSNKVFFAKWLS